jgi:ferredoxin
MSEAISTTALRLVLKEWLKQGKRVIGPRRVKPDLVLYTSLTDPDQLLLEGFIHPANSIKEWVFPRHESIYAYRWKGKDLELSDVEVPTAEQIILAARPCDAAALPILDPLFNWDYQDPFYNTRRQATTVVSLACVTHDDSCFCTSVGLGPTDPRGSDAILLPLGNDEFAVRCLTEKGQALFAEVTRATSADPVIPPGPQRKFDSSQVRTYLTEHFESPLWQEQTLRCLGCGACAYTCPTCHCFDIVDEGNMTGGIRAKNWDSCQFPIFTLHASGHNPRSVQPQRQRQRVLHKFQIYPGKFGEILCTGCGNCTRNCPVNLGLLGVLEAVKNIQAL